MTLSRFIRSKHLVWGILAVLAAVFGLRAAVPFLVQTDLVGRSVEETLEAWTGADVVIGVEPQFSFWPYPRVTLGDVRFLSASAGREELGRIDSLSATFDLLGAVRGRPAFSDFELARPVIRLQPDESGALNWRRGGWMTEAVDAFAAARDGKTPTLRHKRMGEFNIVDGALIVTGRGGVYRITDINGRLDWPTISGRLDLAASAVINGEVTRWTVTCDKPLALLAGRDSAMRIKLSADPATIAFDGVANLSTQTFLSGKLELSARSLGRLLAWQGKEIPALERAGAITVEARVTAENYAAKLEDLRLGLENAQATGVLDVSMPPGRKPRIGGTLAFDRIDFMAVLATLSPAPEKTDVAAAGIDTAFIRQFGLDLRLSAKSAVLGPFSLENLGAGVRTEDGRAAFDIGDATLLGGSLSGRLTLTDQGFQGGGQLQASLRDIDIGGLIQTLKLEGPLPSGRGTADIELTTDRPLPLTELSDLSGRFRLHMDQGALLHFDRQTFEDLAVKRRFFTIGQAAGGTFDFTSAEVDARLDRGLAELTRATIAGSEKTLSLSGIVPYRSGSLALAGRLADTPKDEGSSSAAPALNFFVGGSWPDAVISPLSALTGDN